MSKLAEKIIPIDYEGIKSRQQATWAAGDFAMIGARLQITGEQLCESAGLGGGANVLDVAAGNGNATLAAARRFCRVTSTDYVASLLERGRLRAEADGLTVDFQVEDAENLSFEDDQFDAVISTFGVMFAPDQESAAYEMVRVCRQGGTIATANWTAEGFVGQMFKTVGKHVPPPVGVNSPARWGSEAGLREMFRNLVEIEKILPREFVFRYCSVDHFIDYFKTYFGPIHKAFAALGEDSQGLENDLRILLERFNTATDGTLAVPGEYLEVIMRVR